MLQTACASVYEHKELAEFLPGLWASLRREVRFNGTWGAGNIENDY